MNISVIFIGRMRLSNRCCLTTGRKYELIKQYALNKHVRLLTRLYGIAFAFLLCLQLLQVKGKQKSPTIAEVIFIWASVKDGNRIGNGNWKRNWKLEMVIKMFSSSRDEYNT